ncbi:MAG: hypothetical protein LBG61_02825 [Burkholderiales bacterium]|jgi:hypothetical protein|nr:hypothetical protein [Burkholderiales bacterium]
MSENYKLNRFIVSPNEKKQVETHQFKFSNMRYQKSETIPSYDCQKIDAKNHILIGVTFSETKNSGDYAEKRIETSNQ